MRRKNLLFCFILLSLMIGLTGCPCAWDDIVDITFVNNTDRTLIAIKVYRESTDTVLPEQSFWPMGIKEDSFIPELIIKPQSKHVSRFVESNIIKAINEIGCVRFYFFDLDTINSVSWERIKSENLVVKRVDFCTADDFYRYNNVISVP